MRYLLAIGLILGLSACSDGSASSLYPSSWFGGSDQPPESLAPRGGYGAGVDRRPLVQQVSNVSLDRTAYGVILRATAVTPNQGYFDVDLVAVPNPGAGQLVFDLRAWPPATLTPPGTQSQRQIVTATFISTQSLRGIRQIRVVSATNNLTARP